MLGVEVSHAGDDQVQMELLSDPIEWPGRFQKMANLLERHAGNAVAVTQDQPVLAPLVDLTSRGRLVARPVGVAEQQPVELGQLAGVGRIEDDLAQARVRPNVFSSHTGHYPRVRGGLLAYRCLLARLEPVEEWRRADSLPFWVHRGVLVALAPTFCEQAQQEPPAAPRKPGLQVPRPAAVLHVGAGQTGN